jgi:hypothetical protein
MWFPASMESIQTLPFPIAARVCCTIEKWLNVSSTHVVLLLVDNGAAGLDLVSFLSACYNIYSNAMDIEKVCGLPLTLPFWGV